MCDVQELMRLPTPPVGVVRFFKKGGMYYAIGSDAEFIAQHHLRSIGALKESSNGSGKYVNISEILYASLLRELLLYSRKSIELWEFEGGSWSKAIEASPGNVAPVIDLINSDLDISASSALLSIFCKESVDQIHIFVACCDPTLFTVSTTDFDDSMSLCNLECLLTQTLPSEVILSFVKDPIKSKIVKILDKFGLPYKEFSLKAPVDIGSFPQNKAVEGLIGSLKISLSEFSHKPFQLSEFMTIDYSAQNALNLFPEGPSLGLPTSLYQLLNVCVTPMGSRLLHQYMQQPLIDKTKIEQRLDTVEGLTKSPNSQLAIREALKQVPDVPRLIRRFMSGKASLQDAVRIHDVASIVPKFSNIDCEAVRPIIESVIQHKENAAKVYQLVRTTIDFSAIPQHIYRINPSFDEFLTETYEEITEINHKMEHLRDEIASNAGIEADKIKVERATNLKSFYFRIPRALEKEIRGEDGLTVIETRKDGAHFTSRELNALADKIFDLEENYQREQKEIVKRLITSLANFEPMFQSLSDAFAELDVFCALANVSSSSNFVRAEFGKDLCLEDARHPLIEKRCTFIPNTVHMEKDKSSFLIISGPNSAGKSTLLKTVGICVYLAHVGCFVPCSKAVIPITTSIHARVGAWDSVGMSTFTVEMTEMATILQTASSSSLIIIDELGRSTSCSDGFGLAWTISKHLAQKVGAFTLFATHFHELCALENEVKCVANAHMDAKPVQGILMLYKLVDGPFPKSFGIEAAERAGFMPKVIKRAREQEIILENDDGESSEKLKVTVDPNEPYQKFIDSMRTMKVEEMAPVEVVTMVQKGISSLDEDLGKRV